MDVDSDDEDFQQTAVAKLFAKQSTNQLQSTRSKRQTKYQNKSNSNPEYNEDNDDDAISISSNESGWSVTSEDIMEELKSRNNKRPNKIRSNSTIQSNTKQNNEEEATVLSSSNNPSIHRAKSPSPPPLPPAMAKAKAEKEAKQQRRLSKWTVLRQEVKRSTSPNTINIGMIQKMKKLVESAKQIDTLNKTKEMQHHQPDQKNQEFEEKERTIYQPLPNTYTSPITSTSRSKNPYQNHPSSSFGPILSYGTQRSIQHLSPTSIQTNPNSPNSPNSPNRKNSSKSSKSSKRKKRRQNKKDDAQIIRPRRRGGSYGVGIGRASRHDGVIQNYRHNNYQVHGQGYSASTTGSTRGHLSPNEKQAALWAKEQKKRIRLEKRKEKKEKLKQKKKKIIHMHPTPLNKNASTTPLKKGMVICNFDQEMLNDDTPYYDPYHLYNEDACQEEEELGMFSEKGLIKYKIEIYGKYLSEGAAREWSTVVIVIVIFMT